MNWMLSAALAVLAGANRLAGMLGGRGRLAFAAASAALVWTLGMDWPLVIWAAAADYLWRSLPTRWVWDLAHYERYAVRPDWHAAALGSGVMLAAGTVLLLPFVWTWPGAVLAPVAAGCATAGWIAGAAAYRGWGLARGWLSASKINPAEWVAGLAWGGALLTVGGL